MGVQPEHLHRALCLEGLAPGLILCSRHLDIPDTLEQETPRFFLVPGPASFALAPPFWDCVELDFDSIS